MEYGRQPRPDHGPSRSRRPAALRRAPGLGLLLLALSLSSCALLDKPRLAAFNAALLRLDAAIGSGSTAGTARPSVEKTFATAFKLARASSDWLSLLKRARALDTDGRAGLYAGTADRARAAFPRSEPVAAAAAHAYLRSGRAAQALALFRGPVSPEARPALWAEAFVAARGSGAGAADYGRYAEMAADPRAYLGAAAAALEPAAGADRIAARGWLEKGMEGGAQPPASMLWDCGLYEALAAKSDLSSGSGELALMGDSAWMAGEGELAKRRWERSISLEPRRAWKPYAKLALMSGEGEAGESYWNRLRAAFLSGPASASRDGALGAYAAHLVRRGADDEALALLQAQGRAASEGAGLLRVMAAMIKDRGQPEQRFDADLERLAAESPGDAEALGAVLRALAIRGRYGELAILRDEAARKALPLRYGWYFESMVLAAREDFKGAALAIQAAGPAAGPAGDYALGSIEGALGDAKEAAAAFARAAASARRGPERAAADKGLGRALGELGDGAGAAGAFRSAAEADPSDVEAAVLARGNVKK